MRRLVIIFCAFVPFLVEAQGLDVLDVRPAHPGEGVLTVESITTGKGVRPVARMYSWTSDDVYAYKTRTGVVSAKVSDGIESDTPATAEDPRIKGVSATCCSRTAFSCDGSLYILEDEPRMIAEAGPGVVYGTSVSRNEFGISGGLFWSPDASRLAFYRKDESLVSEFPLLDIKTRTGTLSPLRYPMNGMQSEHITLGIYDVEAGSTVYVEPDDFGEDRYLTCVSWDPGSEHVFIQVLDRSQHHMRLNMYRASDGSFVRTILSEDNDAWVEPDEPLHFIDGGSFIYTTDNRDGYKSLYLCDTLGTVRRLTGCDADVAFAGFHDGYVYYTSAEFSPVENHLMRMRIKPARRGGISRATFSAPERLTAARGWHDVKLSPGGEWFIDSWSSFGTAPSVDLRTCDGALVRELYRAEDPLDGIRTGEVRFGTVKSADGVYDNYYRLFLPVNFDPGKKYPLIVYVYGGPHSQMVRDTWLANVRLLELYWAQQGYVVYVQDNRGTSNRGAAFEKAINRQCGQAEMADQMVGIMALMEQPWVDEERVGVHGWSYGGFMTISLMTNYPDVFKVGVAGGPVIDWKWYEIMYGERYMDTEATNPEGFAKTGLIRMAPSLKGKLLICQGAVDDTVVWEHSLSFVQECIEHGVQLDYFPYPCTQHNVMGRWRVHLNQKIVNYFEDYL